MKRIITIALSEQTDWRFKGRELKQVRGISVREGEELGTGRHYRFVVRTVPRTPGTLGADSPASECGVLIACRPDDWPALWQNIMSANDIESDGEMLPSLDLDLDTIEAVEREL